MKYLKNFKSILTQVSLYILITNIALAETYTWTGAINGNWLDSGNWSPTGVPEGGDDAIIAATDNFPDIDDQVIGVKNILIETEATLRIAAEYGLGQLFCNTIKIESGATLINRSQLFVWRTQGSQFGTAYAIENFGYFVNLETGSDFGETGLLTLSNDVNGGLASTFYFHNTGRVQINYTHNNSIVGLNDDYEFLNDGIINIHDSNARGFNFLDGEDSHFTNNGTINIRKTRRDGIRMEIPFYNSATGTINIGQEGESILNHGFELVEEKSASLINNGGTIRIDNAAGASSTWYALSASKSNVINQNGGQILIGQGDGNIGDTGISLHDESTLTNNNSIIKISNTIGNGIHLTSSSNFYNQEDGLLEVRYAEEAGLYLASSSSLSNEDNAAIDIDHTGLSGILLYNNASYTNTDNSTCRIDDADGPGISIVNSSSFENTENGLVAISENDLSGTGPNGQKYAMLFQGADNYFVNDNCAEIYMYLPVNWTNDQSNSLNNTGYIFIDTDGSHNGTPSLVSNGIISYKQENYFNGLINQGLLVKPLTLGACEIEDVIEYGQNSFTVATIWFSDEAMTIEAGTYSQATNTFKITNLPASSTSDLYFSAIKDVDNCHFIVRTSLIADNYNEGEIVWTGEQSNNWHSSCNWFPQLLPGEESNIIIPSTTTPPTINNGVAAFSKTIHIEAGGSLDIAFANSLTIEGAELGDNALINEGTLTNDGTITVKDCMAKSIVNQGTLVNNTDGIISLYDGGGYAFEQGGGANGSFVNNGKLEIYSINSRAISLVSGQIENNHIIEIGFKGVSFLGNIGLDGINLAGGSTFTNNENGSVRIKNIGNVGIANFFGTFENEGIIEIDYTTFSGIWNEGNFDNNGSLRIGMNGSTNNNSILNHGIRQSWFSTGNFKNLENGVIEIANTASETIGYSNGSFENSGNVFSHGQILIDESETLRLKSGRFEILNE